ncbi:cytochrome c oxidase subunit III family protein [Synechococcus sp. BIOS-U3-1]|uniref:cytochrome c oxidase subunit 3 n=1 Tax=Synechococcus sp. BIOS-U3-1 TaxID=1400865 RepID=UPI001646F903|nr:heme-copper oxidase subunit III [Synechococcus sp. BIOS-U3-1]QNI59239.1 cytochrome c oxidase subunit III family protein [Synechococcus sp. BIOS-U3-1]|tara:strand:- start:2930 stop:3535 length:606 start_codon:yes stop_codon:yes gene_type:complete
MTSANVDLPLKHKPGHIKHDGHNLTGFIIFLCSESIIFLAFFVGYALLKITSPEWLPEGVEGLETRMPLINTVILVSSSFVAYFAERYLHKENLWGFRAMWLLTMAMGSYFVYGQYVEWSELAFSLSSGVFGGTFYLLTGFHGLHVITGILLMGLMLARSFRPNNYAKGEMGVTAVSLFWHFVDVIWIILYVLIYVWQRTS